MHTALPAAMRYIVSSERGEGSEKCGNRGFPCLVAPFLTGNPSKGAPQVEHLFKTAGSGVRLYFIRAGSAVSDSTHKPQKIPPKPKIRFKLTHCPRFFATKAVMDNRELASTSHSTPLQSVPVELD
jgi:hypothetical protein